MDTSGWGTYSQIQVVNGFYETVQVTGFKNAPNYSIRSMDPPVTKEQLTNTVIPECHDVNGNYSTKGSTTKELDQCQYYYKIVSERADGTIKSTKYVKRDLGIDGYPTGTCTDSTGNPFYGSLGCKISCGTSDIHGSISAPLYKSDYAFDTDNLGSPTTSPEMVCKGLAKNNIIGNCITV
jgi:hypothetical protein